MLWTDLDRFGSLVDPWRSLERVNRAADGFRSASEFPAVNVWSDGDSSIVTAELAGIDPGRVDISVVGRSVTLRVSREPEESREGESFHRRERWYGQFSRSLDLPYMIDADKVEAKFSKGVLHLTLPRAVAERPKKIAIRTE